jgi:DNA polymerase V
MNAVRDQFGKNAMPRAMDLLPNAMARERNRQIGGHRSGD